jgi:hypothetical protein
MDSTTCGDTVRYPPSWGFASLRKSFSFVVARYAAGPMRGQSVDAVIQVRRAEQRQVRSASADEVVDAALHGIEDRLDA